MKRPTRNDILLREITGWVLGVTWLFVVFTEASRWLDTLGWATAPLALALVVGGARLIDLGVAGLTGTEALTMPWHVWIRPWLWPAWYRDKSG